MFNDEFGTFIGEAFLELVIGEEDSDFDDEDKRKITLETFIFGDLHWNKLGTKIIFNRLISEINF